MQSGEQILLRQTAGANQPVFVFEQFDEKKSRREQLRMTARPDTLAQITASGDKAFERDVGINDDALRAHRSGGGMNRSLFAAHQPAFISSASRSASVSVNWLRCAISSNRSQSSNALRRFGDTASLEIVTRKSASVFSTVIMLPS